MKRLTTIAVSLLAMFLVSACGDDAATAPSSPNAFVVNGDGYTGVEVTATSSFANILSSSSSITVIGSLGGEAAEVKLLIDGGVPGDYTWNSKTKVTLMVGSGSTMKMYTGTSGTTTLTSVGNAGGKAVGTYVGTLANDADATKKLEINGKFTANIQ